MSQDHWGQDHLGEDVPSQDHLGEDAPRQDHLGEDVGTARELSSGHPQVDEVLRTLDDLSDLPLDQHVALFEAAHVGLRDALKDARPAAPAHG